MSQITATFSEADQQPKSPYYWALHASRYERQQQIRAYEEISGRRLVIFLGVIVPEVVPPFSDAIQDVDKADPLDLMLVSPGGDGETAYRLASMCSRIPRFTLPSSAMPRPWTLDCQSDTSNQIPPTGHPSGGCLPSIRC